MGPAFLLISRDSMNVKLERTTLDLPVDREDFGISYDSQLYFYLTAAQLSLRKLYDLNLTGQADQLITGRTTLKRPSVSAQDDVNFKIILSRKFKYLKLLEDIKGRLDSAFQPES